MRKRQPANEKAPPLSSQLKLPNRALVSRGPKLFELNYGDNYAVNAFELHERRPLVSHLIQVTWAILQPVTRFSIFSLFFILVSITYIDVFVQVLMRSVSSRVCRLFGMFACNGCLRCFLYLVVVGQRILDTDFHTEVGKWEFKKGLSCNTNFFPVEMFDPEAHFQLESG